MVYLLKDPWTKHLNVMNFLVVLRVLGEGLPRGDEAPQGVVGVHGPAPLSHAA